MITKNHANFLPYLSREPNDDSKDSSSSIDKNNDYSVDQPVTLSCIGCCIEPSNKTGAHYCSASFQCEVSSTLQMYHDTELVDHMYKLGVTRLSDGSALLTRFELKLFGFSLEPCILECSL